MERGFFGKEKLKLCILAKQMQIGLMFVSAFSVTLMPCQGFQQPGLKFTTVCPPEYQKCSEWLGLGVRVRVRFECLKAHQ